MSNALERLLNSASEPQHEYSLEEQMASAIANTEEEDDDFSDMSEAAKKAFFGGRATEVTYSEPQEEVQPQPQYVPQMAQPQVEEEPVQQSAPPLTQFINQQANQTQQQTIQSIPLTTEPMEEEMEMEEEFEEEEATYNEPITPEPISEPEPVVQKEIPKKKAGRPAKKVTVEKKVQVEEAVTQEKQVAPQIIDDLFIPVMNQLALDLIDNLKQNDYKISRFNTSQMQILYNYMKTKF